MDALDLTKAPPRTPREPLADLDVLMAARSVDKIRATLPGGDLGDYRIDGFTSRFFEILQIDEADFRSVVALAHSDADVAAWLRRHSTQEKFEEVNRVIGARRLRDRIDDPDFQQRYPNAASFPLDIQMIDLLPLDDQLAFRADR
jgi:hypothetical protein